MLNKIDKVESYNEEKLESILNTKIEDDLLSNNKFKRYVEKISNKLNSINPTDLKQIYKDTKIKICHKFISNAMELEIDMDTINIKSMSLNYSKFSKLKNMIVSEIEDEVDERWKYKEKLKNTIAKELRYEYLEKIEKSDNYIDKLSKDLDNDLTIKTNVDSIEVVRNQLGFIEQIIVNKDYILNVNDVLNEELFDGKYSQILEIIDGNFVVNTLKQEEAPNVDYCAHVEIDQVYGLEGKWGLVDKDDNVIIEPIYIYPFIECGDNLQVMLPHEYKMINGKKTVVTLKHGLIDKLGKVIIPVKYIYMNSIDNIGTYFTMLDPITYKVGVIDKNNNIVVPFDYEYISSPDLEQCTKTKYCTIYPDYIYQVKVVNNDLYGIYDLKLKREIIKPKYKYMKIVDYNRFLVGEDYEHCNILIDELEGVIK